MIRVAIDISLDDYLLFQAPLDLPRSPLESPQHPQRRAALPHRRLLHQHKNHLGTKKLPNGHILQQISRKAPQRPGGCLVHPRHSWSDGSPGPTNRHVHALHEGGGHCLVSGVQSQLIHLDSKSGRLGIDFKGIRDRILYRRIPHYFNFNRSAK